MKCKQRVSVKGARRDSSFRALFRSPLSVLQIFLFACLAAGLASLNGCASAVQAGQNTALNGADLVAITDDMSMKIMGSAGVQEAIAKEGSLRVVVEPVVNDMRAELLPKGPANAFTARLRTLLSKHAPNQFTWIMNKAAFYDLRGKELSGVELGPSPDAVNPEYALTATFTSLANENSQGRSSYYVCSFELTNLQTRVLLWSDKYEVQKKAVRGFLD
jgi:PBP1b-binding outer membrane lipoprotein LpoB